jgi:2-polyprenyl-6-methoxyphenol hydroxylase-like FAD-dependent oxidoreductase
LNQEITIIGGGLVGLSLGIALRRRGLGVRLIEAGRYPRHRVCGEFISGVGRETLETLGIAACFDDARQHRTIAWNEGGHPLFRGQLPEPALGISRYRLDERLAGIFVALGGELVTGQHASPQPGEGQVWAAGRRPQADSRWLGLKAHVRMELAADLEMHSGSNGYTGLAGIEDGWTNVCGLFRVDHEIRAKGRDLLPAYMDAGGNSGLAARLRTAEWRDRSFSAVAGFCFGSQPMPSGTLFLGDAERMIPPFTGNGMSMAFQAAECAVQPLVDWARGVRSWQASAAAIRDGLRRRFRGRVAVASLLNRALFHSGARAALRSLAVHGLLPFRPMLALVR